MYKTPNYQRNFFNILLTNAWKFTNGKQIHKPYNITTYNNNNVDVKLAEQPIRLQRFLFIIISIVRRTSQSGGRRNIN